MLKNNWAFTLTEIIIVVVLVGMMAAFALPNYLKSAMRADERSAVANLMAIRSAVKIYLVNTGAATVPGMGSLAAINTGLGLGISDPKMTYSCAGNTCQATHPNGWSISFQAGGGNEGVYCSSGVCPGCPNSPGSCG